MKSSLAELSEIHHRRPCPRDKEPAALGPAATTRLAVPHCEGAGNERTSKPPIGLGGAALVAMMKPTHLGEGDDLTPIGRLYQARLWAILFEGEVGPRVVIIPQVGRQKPPEVVFAQDNDVIEAVASD